MTLTDGLFGRKSVREALKDWHQSKELGEHPLARLQLTELRRRQARQSYSDTPAGRGVALRQVLHEVLEAMKPDEPTPDFNNPQWRYYLILYQQYVKEQRAAQIQDMLGISESGYFKDQRQALERLGNILREREVAVSAVAAVEEDAALPADTPSPPPAAEPPTAVAPLYYVPLQPTPFIGRAQELQQIEQALAEPGCRLLTLVGPGGIGKTRLAVESAQRLSARFAHGVVFVPLAPLRNADLLAPTIASAVQLALGSAEDVRRRIVQFLQPRQMLIVLDNFEQVVAGAELLRYLLDHCPQLKLLVTSRFSLDLHGEWILEVDGLDLPLRPDDERFEEYAGIRLFAAAMRRVQPGATLAAADRPCILQLCRQLGGMPLGIELAASWLPLLPCAEIVAEIGRNADFLASSLRDLPPRHRSLRGVFDHSWELLSGPERKALQRLAVFAGSFSREAAQEAASANLLLLRSLKNKSLLRVDASGRYAVQELLRQYAEEKLRLDGEEWRAARQRHSRYYLSFLQERGVHLRGGPQQLRAQRQLLPEINDIRAAWEWAVRDGQTALVLESAPALYLLYDLLNRAREGLAAFEQATAVPWPSDDSDGRACALLCQALRVHFHARLGNEQTAADLLRRCFGELCAAREQIAPHWFAWTALAGMAVPVAAPPFDVHVLYRDALAIFKARGDVWGQAHLELRYGVVLRLLDVPEQKQQAAELFRHSLTLHEVLPDLWGVSKCLNYLGHIAYESGDYAAAERYGRRSLELYQELGDRLGMAHAFYSLGQVRSTQGDYATAQQYYRDGLAVYRELGNAQELAAGLDSLGYVTYLRGAYAEAERYYRESLSLSRTLGDLSGTAWSLHNLGDIARVSGDYEQARALYQESHDLHRAHNPLSWGRMVALDKLGLIGQLAGDWQVAWQDHRRALQLSIRIARPRESLDALWALAQVALARPAEIVTAEAATAEAVREMALLWLATILAHPGAAQETRRAAAARWEALTADMPAEAIAHLRARGAALSLPDLLHLPLLGESFSDSTTNTT